ncbi:hypothetical protein V2J09_003470 [Rumex salicifolius]
MNSSSSNTWEWLHSLPPLHQWKHNSISIPFCSSTSPYSSYVYLSLSISKITPTPSTSTSNSPFICLSIAANSSTLPLPLWTSKPIKISPTTPTLISTQSIQTLFLNNIQDILNYGCFSIQLPSTITTTLFHESSSFLRDSFNLSLLTLAFLVCIYEAPLDLRPFCLVSLKDRLSEPRSKDASRLLMRALGATLEERWMRSLNLGVTNWKAVIDNSQIVRCPSPMFSNSVSGFGMWKLHFYCPVVAMEVESSSGGPADKKLMFSLMYHQLEGVVQLNHKVVVKDKWIEVMVNIDNIRLSVVPLVSEALLSNRGVGVSEKHFPSRISLQLAPSLPSSTDILSVSVNKSSGNPSMEIEHEKGIEGSFEPPTSLIPALRVSATETTTTTLKPWKFEESAHGNSVAISWFLHDVGDGREVFSSKPSKMAFFEPRAWFRNRYKSANRPFTRQGGVVFAKNEYGDHTVCWKVDKGAVGRKMEWEIKGCIGLTYWPNRHWTFYNETRRAEFNETFHLSLS